LPGGKCNIYIKMKVWVIDAGGSKSDWWAFIDGETLHYETKGFHPLWDQDSLEKEILPEVLNSWHHNLPDRVFYYGTGCAKDKVKMLIYGKLKRYLPNSQIEVQDDLMGAARALSPGKSGVISILGTGSSSGLYDGKSFANRIKSLGFLAGDEGSGSYLGKLIIQTWVYRDMPDLLQEKLEFWIKKDQDTVISELYAAQLPAGYLAQFSRFASKHKSDPFVSSLIKYNFGLFVDKILRKYEGIHSIPCHFCGSFAFHFKNELTDILKERKISLGKVVGKPGELLLKYHLKE
jgi:glucosamine kinase